jgi:hypothetical protein
MSPENKKIRAERLLWTVFRGVVILIWLKANRRGIFKDYPQCERKETFDCEVLNV